MFRKEISHVNNGSDDGDTIGFGDVIEDREEEEVESIKGLYKRGLIGFTRKDSKVMNLGKLQKGHKTLSRV